MASPLRVGIDLVRVSEVEASIARFGDRYLDRVFTAHERASCARSPRPAEGLAARFAAKEAAMKVLRPSADDVVSWTAIEVVRAPGGWTELALSGGAALLARAAGLDDFAVSLSHDGDHATAVVVATSRAPLSSLPVPNADRATRG
jgi:holo-[acyl-carrier protein] synthase